MLFKRTAGVTSEWSGERVVILDSRGEVMTTLSPVGALLWDWLPADLRTLVANLQERFPDVEQATLSQDTEHFLVELRAAGLVQADAAG